MTVLWLAFGIYIVGIASVLYFRPTTMFRPGAGTWKEFGLNSTGNYTVFPFWMFTMVWAMLSYVFATVGAIFVASLALPRNVRENVTISPISYAAPPAPPALPPALPNISSAMPQSPGYYILDQSINGVPKYIYFGTEPPTLANLSIRSTNN